ncbi:MAG: MBL fold metallo-hydrolase [Myxococcota bacterium]
MRRLLSMLTTAVLLSACDAPVSESGPDPVSLELRTFTSADEGFHTNSMWVDTGAEVVVFDAQFTPALAQSLVDEIQSQTDSPIRWLVVTHPNPDKFNGASTFRSLGAQVVASQATAEAMPGVHAYKEAFFVGSGAFEPGQYPALAPVDLTFDDALELPLAGGGQITLEVLDHGGVATTQTVAIVEDDDGPAQLVVGDLVASRTHAWLEGGIVDGVAAPDLAQWRDALDDLAGLTDDPASPVYPGRGEPLPVAEAVGQQRDYLTALEQIVHAVLSEQDDPAAALGGDQAGAIYDEITARAEQAFPSYDHAYLITSGVYGLAWSLVSD